MADIALTDGVPYTITPGTGLPDLTFTLAVNDADITAIAMALDITTTSSESPVVSAYLRFGTPPTTSTFDARCDWKSSPTPSEFLSTLTDSVSTSGTYYVLLTFDSISAISAGTLTVSSGRTALLPFDVTTITDYSESGVMQWSGSTLNMHPVLDSVTPGVHKPSVLSSNEVVQSGVRYRIVFNVFPFIAPSFGGGDLGGDFLMWVGFHPTGSTITIPANATDINYDSANVFRDGSAFISMRLAAEVPGSSSTFFSDLFLHGYDPAEQTSGGYLSRFSTASFSASSSFGIVLVMDIVFKSVTNVTSDAGLRTAYVVDLLIQKDDQSEIYADLHNVSLLSTGAALAVAETPGALRFAVGSSDIQRAPSNGNVQPFTIGVPVTTPVITFGGAAPAPVAFWTDFTGSLQETLA